MAVLRKRYKTDGKSFNWVVDFRHAGKRYVKSTGTSDLTTAEIILKNVEASPPDQKVGGPTPPGRTIAPESQRPEVRGQRSEVRGQKTSPAS